MTTMERAVKDAATFGDDPAGDRRPRPVRVFVIDDHPMIRHGLAAMIRGEREFEWVGEAASGDDALKLAPALLPDLVLVDLVMPGPDGVATIEALKPLLPAAHFVVLTSVLEPAEVRRAMDAGAGGYLLKSASTQELVTVMRSAARGQRVLAPEVSDALAADERAAVPGADLTQRERELLGLMARGLSNQQISNRLGIAMPTVKFHVTNILAKLHADNRTEAVLTALRSKIVSLD
ncbi:MAG: response regulator transcription factor [Rubrivivax sp.]|nr:response regulator transcription factor [Rubrivivax sp.]